MAIHQINIGYDGAQDRILMRVSTTEGEEFQFWLTRRFVKSLWALLVRMLEQDRPVRQQFDEDMKRTVLGIRHEGFAQKGNFSAQFEEREYRRPLGEEPLLLARAEGNQRDDGSYLLRLHPQPGQGIDMALDAGLLHLFTKLLTQAVAKTDWDINLDLYQGKEQSPQAAETQPRKLN